MKRKLLDMAGMSVSPEALARLRAVADVTSLAPDRGQLLDRIGQSDVLLIALKLQIDRIVLERTTRLKLIVTPTTGLDHIDLVAAAERGVTVFSLREDRAFLNQITATAEMAWTLLLATVRNLASAFDSVKDGTWESGRFRGRQLSGRTLGVVGYGRLGHMVAEYARAFRMRVLVCDNKPNDTPNGVEQVPFDRLVKESDVISIHIHATPQNTNLFSAGVFEMMKRGAVLINTSRGEIIDEDAFLAALQAGRLAGAGLDVISGERRPDIGNHPLIQYAKNHDNLLITPHIGGVTYDSQSLVSERIVDRIVEFLRKLDKTTP
jgi:D-3-phosphoglycerate dehydrogenase